jgi:hypothetical protein
MIEADSQQIKQVIWNLFVNSAQTMDESGELKLSTQIVPLDSLDEKISSRLNNNAIMQVSYGLRQLLKIQVEGYRRNPSIRFLTPFLLPGTKESV